MQTSTFRHSLGKIARDNCTIHTMSVPAGHKGSIFLHKPDPSMIRTRSVSEIKLRLGLIADVQFAPRTDAKNYSGTRVRRYHNGLAIFCRAVDAWNGLYESPAALFPKTGRNPFVGANGKPLGCMCETETCVSKKCVMRTQNLLASGIDAPVVIPGVCVRHNDIPDHPLPPLRSPEELGYKCPDAHDVDNLFPDLPKALPPTMSQLSPSSFLIPSRPLDAVLQLGDIIDGSNATLKTIAYADPQPCDTSCPYCHGSSTPLEYTRADVPVTPAPNESPLMPPPCPTLTRAIAARVNALYTPPPTFPSAEGPVEPQDVVVPPEAVPLALASVFTQVRRTRCLEWHHLVGNHELYNIHRHALYPLLGRGVQAGALVPYTTDKQKTEAKTVTSVTEAPSAPNLPPNPPTRPADPYDYGHYYATPLRRSETAATSGTIMENIEKKTCPDSEAGQEDVQYWLIVLDAYRMAIMGTPRNHPAHTQSHAFLSGHNPIIASGAGGDFSKGLPKESMRFVPFNGGIGTEQFAWLDKVLANLPPNSRAIVTCHVSTAPASTGFSTTLWDREQLLEIFRRYPGKVCLYLSGHDHDGGYTYDSESRTHHMTVAAPIECRPGEQAWGLLDLYNDGVQVYGAGKIQDMWLSFK